MLFDFLVWLVKALASYLAIIIVFAIVVGLPIAIFDHFRFKRLVRKRAGLSICQFARSFDCRHVDTRIIRAVYEALQGWTSFGIKQFPIMAVDDLNKVYGLKDEDLDDFAENLAQAAKRGWTDLERNPLYGKVTTAKDLVLFLNFQPKQTG